MFLQCGEQLPQPCFVLGQRFIKKALAGAAERGGVVFALANVESAVNIESLIHTGAPLHHSMAAVTTPDAERKKPKARTRERSAASSRDISPGTPTGMFPGPV